MAADSVNLPINRSIVRAALTMRATVYARAASGQFSTVVKSDLACLLTEVMGGRQPATTAAQRRELANLGTLMFDAEYVMPETGVQIAVDAYPGKRWNLVAATHWPDYAPGLGFIARSVDVVRAS